MTLISRSAGGLWRKKKLTIPSLSSIDGDSIILSKFIGVKYIIHFRNETQDKFKTLELLSTKVSSNNLKDTVYGNLGDSLQISTNTIISGSDMILRIVNGENFPLEVVISKLILS